VAISLALAAVNYEAMFNEFAQVYHKSYSSQQEYTERLEIFISNIKDIERHNAEGHGWTMKVNEHADRTRAEFINTRRLIANSEDEEVIHNNNNNNNIIKLSDYHMNVADSVDWVGQGIVTDVKDQGQCGSCWAFSTTGSIESAVALATGKLISLSEQQLLDCTGSEYKERACHGGSVPYAYRFIMANGACAETDYPYQASKGSCKKCTPVSKISSFVNVTTNSEDALKIAAAQQPISVMVDASQWPSFYSGGVYSESCGTNLDHYVMVVGYGTMGGQDYWKVKNSWGDSWGENGYIYLARNVNVAHGQCGVALKPRYPVY